MRVLSHLSEQQRRDEIEPLITDEMVGTIEVVAPHDRLAAAIVDRYDGVCSKVEFSTPVTGPEDAERLASAVREIQGSPGQ